MPMPRGPAIAIYPNLICWGGAHWLVHERFCLAYKAIYTYAVSIVVGVKGRSVKMGVSSPVFVLNYK